MKVILDSQSLCPTYANPGDAGADLRARLPKPIHLQPGEIVSVPTGVRAAIPHGLVGQVCPRSGLALKYGLSVVNAPGIVDSSFRGEICVILQVRGDRALEIKPGDRIAQLLLVPFVTVSFEPVDHLDDTDRGEGGFGSTGTH